MRVFLIIAMFFLAPFNVSAQAPSGQDTENLGMLAGAVLACKAHRQLYQFEEILSRYFSNTAPSQAAEEAIMRIYAEAKAKSYVLQRKRSKQDCAQTVFDFSRMNFFKFELYSDGTLKDSNGKFLYPRGQNRLANGAERTYPKPTRRK